MDKILIFSGTSDGGRVASFLAENGYEVTVSVATEYGEKCAPEGENITVRRGRMALEEMRELIAGGFSRVIDATHPYAEAASENIKNAAAKAGAEYLRLLRDDLETDGVIRVNSVKAAAEFLREHEGRALVTTGGKELEEYTAVEDYGQRIVARVLSSAESVEKCRALGFEGKNLIAMQGPFSEEMNYATLKETGASWLVTKCSGTAGGFEEKLKAAKRAGVGVILIKRPAQDINGLSLRELIFKLTGKTLPKEVSLVGIGMGGQGFTDEARRALRNAELIIGARRMLKAAGEFGKRSFEAYKAEETAEKIISSDFSRIAVALSGDVGFYSGAARLGEVLKTKDNVSVKMIPGVSSVAYLAARLQKPWDDAVILSLHGRSGNIVSKVRHNKKVFAIAGRGEELGNTLKLLRDNGLGGAMAYIGSELSYENERILAGTVSGLCEEKLGDLCTVLIENDEFIKKPLFAGIPDERFERGNVPMTKEEVRTISLSKLRVEADSVIYDIGAGTGAVSVEAASAAENGVVYAIERNAEACGLIEKNIRKFALTNIKIINAAAPGCLKELPAPTHVFIGGSAGGMREIVETVMEKNPRVRVVINTIALESTAKALEIVSNLPVTEVDITQVTVAKARKISKYNMMTGSNPIYIISFTGRQN